MDTTTLLIIVLLVLLSAVAAGTAVGAGTRRDGNAIATL